MTTRFRFLPALGMAALLAGTSAMAQDLTIVLQASETGLQSYNMAQSGGANVGSTLIYDTLVAQDTDNSYHPALAESWEEAADGMSWTFKLKPGVTFHNGVPLTAQSVVDWLALFTGGDNEYLVDAIAGAEALDDLTVKLTMKRPEPNLLFNLASPFMGVMEAGAVKGLGEDYGVTEAVGTGAYKLESLDPAGDIVLVRNDAYSWGPDLAQNKGPANFEHVVLKNIAESSTAFLELKTGGVDMVMGAPTDLYEQMKAEPNIGLATQPGQEVAYIVFNTAKPPFDKLEMRQAAALAVNQAEILQAVYGGVGIESHQFLISSLPEAKVSPEYLISYDGAKANAILDAEGWAMGADGIRQKDGQALEIELYTDSSTDRRRTAEVVQAQLKAVGIGSNITSLDPGIYWGELGSKGEFNQAVVGYGWNNADILDWFFAAERIGAQNVSGFNDPKAEELRITAMTGSKNAAERQANFIAYHEYILSQFSFAPYYEPVQLYAYNKDKLAVPEVIRGTRFSLPAVLDSKPVE
jgi:peptide/nickel transport system substrate-binding protein